MTTRDVDHHVMHELELYIENTSELYNQKKSIIANIVRRKQKGTYDPRPAPKLWLYWVDAGARMYVKEFGGSVATIFDKPTREALAEELARKYSKRIDEHDY